MRDRLQQILTPRIVDEQLHRQGLLIMIVSSALTVLSLALTGMAIRSNQSMGIIAVTLGGSVLYVACAIMARNGIIQPAAYLLTWFPVLGIVANQGAGFSAVGTAFYCIPILMASLVLSSRGVIPLALFSLGAVIVAINRSSPAETNSFYSIFFFILMISALAYLGAWSVERALQSARDARSQLQQANATLQVTNSTLEQRVTERTAELASAFSEAQRRSAEQADLLAEIEQQRAVIRELSVPVLPVSCMTLVMPLVGALDSSRLLQIQAQALNRLEETHARRLLLDITGVPVVDSQVAQGLLSVVQAARLLGAEVALVGIRPEVAQTIVGLGLDLSSVRAHSDLQGALQYS